MSKDFRSVAGLLLCVLVCACLAPSLAQATGAAGASLAWTTSPAQALAPSALRQLLDVQGLSLTASADQPDEDQASPTAVYDILAHVVVLPDGSRLEAHSGLGERVDDPRFVREHMRGATPPALYDLQPRRGLFHGVAALRLLPRLGDVFGRAGLLAHTYMLRGGRAESNGCVVFRDYAAFLKAFREGRIRRLRVVPAIGDMAVRGNDA